MIFYIYPRRGFAFKPIYPGMKPLTHPRQIVTNISSTMVREKLLKGLPGDQLLPKPVTEYIKQKRLFLTAWRNWNTKSFFVWRHF